MTRLLRVYAPVLKGAYHELTEIKSAGEVDLGYQNLWNALPARSANEVNHVLTVGLVLTSGRR